MPVQFDRSIEYIVKNALDEKPLTGKTNPETWQLWKQGYVVLRNFIPKDIITMTMDTWKTIEMCPKQWGGDIEPEVDIIFESPQDTLYKSEGLYNSPFGVALQHFVWRKLKTIIDMDLEETYSYSRKYYRGAYLKSHADRPSCEISATLCLDYMSDDNTPWTIWVDNSSDWVNRPNEVFNETQGLPIKDRKTARKIDLEVGDILLYQGPNVAHWRERFLGDHSYHVFLHFMNFAGMVPHMPGVQKMVGDMYPYGAKRNYEYNPCHLDGRLSRYHPLDENDPKRKLYTSFMTQVWDNKKYWLTHNKSDYVNNYQDFVQIIDGKEVECDTFTPKYKLEKSNVKRPR